MPAPWRDIAGEMVDGSVVLLIKKPSESRGGSAQPCRMWTFKNKLSMMRVLMTLAETNDLMSNFVVHEIVDGKTKTAVKLSGHYNGFKHLGTERTNYASNNHDYPIVPNARHLIERVMGGKVPEQWSDPEHSKFNDFEELLIEAQGAGSLPVPRPDWEHSYYKKYDQADFNPDHPERRDPATVHPDMYAIVRTEWEEYGEMFDQKVKIATTLAAAESIYSDMVEEVNQEVEPEGCCVVELQGLYHGETTKTLKTTAAGGE